MSASAMQGRHNQLINC